MSSGLMASAHRRMQQKREKASPASRVSSPASVASPSSARVTSPANNNSISTSGQKSQGAIKSVPASTSQDVSRLDSMQHKYKYTSPPQQQYSPQYGANNNNASHARTQQQNYSQPRTASTSPQISPRNYGNYSHHSSERNQSSSNMQQRTYDSSNNNQVQQKYKQQYYKHLQQPPPPPPPTPPVISPQSRLHGEAQYNSYSPRSVPNGNERMSPYYQDSAQMQEDELMQGGEYEYDITEDEEDYIHERDDRIAPMKLPMQQRSPVYSQPVDEENETMSSEIALNGNPSKKKKEKKKLSTDARYLIHNTGSDDAIDGPDSVSDARYGIHNNGEDENDEVEDERVAASPVRQYDYGDIAAHAGRYAAGGQPESYSPKPNRATTTNPFDDDEEVEEDNEVDEGKLPEKLGGANSWDVSERKKNSYAASNYNANDNVPVWEDDSSNTMQKFDRNSKSWEQEKSSFEQNLWAGSFFGDGSQSKQEDEHPNDEKDKKEDVPKVANETLKNDRELDAVMDKSYPWKAQQLNQSNAPTEYTRQQEVKAPVPDPEESDGDSLFEFEKKTTETNTVKDLDETFQQTGGSRNAAKTKQDAASVESAEQRPKDRNDMKSRNHRSRRNSPSRNVAFAGEERNKVHRYRVQDDAQSASDSGTYETRDYDDDETDGDTLEDGDTIDNYTYDDATYGESTIGGTIDTSRHAQNDFNIVEHMDTAVKAIGSALGGIILMANNAASSLSADNDDSKGTSTVGQESGTTFTKTAAASEYDWIDYMEKILFPEGETSGEVETQGGSTNGTTLRSNSNTASATVSAEDEGDEHLLQQAVAAAKAVHHINGVQFDETHDINVLTDIKFVVVTVELPLGLLFQEHELGAWVARVVPDGNGARKEVQPGDQLAAINGKSSARATIDEVASIISSTPRNEGVELTFLRYVGSLRPVAGAIVQEGFEVTDKNVSSNGKKSKKGIFGLKKANQSMGNKASLDFSPNQRRAKNIKISMTQEPSKPNSNVKQGNKGKSKFKKMFGGKKKS